MATHRMTETCRQEAETRRASMSAQSLTQGWNHALQSQVVLCRVLPPQPIPCMGVIFTFGCPLSTILAKLPPTPK